MKAAQDQTPWERKSWKLLVELRHPGGFGRGVPRVYTLPACADRRLMLQNEAMDCFHVFTGVVALPHSGATRDMTRYPQLQRGIQLLETSAVGRKGLVHWGLIVDGYCKGCTNAIEGTDGLILAGPRLTRSGYLLHADHKISDQSNIRLRRLTI